MGDAGGPHLDKTIDRGTPPDDAGDVYQSLPASVLL